MDFEEILVHIGKFGPFQWRVYIILCIITMVTPFHLFSQIFFVKPVDHWCYDSSVDALNCSLFDVADDIGCTEAKKNLSIPRNHDGDGYQSCEKYQFDGDTGDYVFDVEGNIVITGCDEGWVYDQRVTYGYSIISDFDLVCHRKSFPEISISIFFVTILFVIVFVGWISDIIGRQLTILFLSLVLLISGLAVCVAQTFWTYTILRSISGPCIVGLFSVPFVLGAEIVSSENRVLTGFIVEYFFAIGYILTAVFAYFIDNWRYLQLALTLPAVMVIAFMPFTIESPRWLLSRGHNKRALKIIDKIAKGNKKQVPDICLEPQCSNPKEKSDEAKVSMKEILRNRVMLTRTLILMVAWFTNNVVFMVISYSAGNFGVNVIIGSLLLAAVEVPANTIAMVTVKYFGRRYSQSCMFLLAAAASILSRFIPLGTWQVTAVVIGKLAISASFNTIFVYTAEIYPTSVRSFSLSLCSMMARVGGTIFPYILLLADVWQHLPLLIAGMLAVVSGVGILFLPETKSAPLPTTIEEAVHIGRARLPISSTYEEDTDEKLEHMLPPVKS